MEKALLYKEWKKTNWYIGGIAIVGVGLLVYIYIKMGRSFRIAGMEHLWDVIINKDQFLFRDLKFYPLAVGMCLGLSQFIPEVIQKRIKLTLHLPLEESKTVFLMLMYGTVFLLVFFVIHLMGIVLFANVFFSKEIVISLLITCIPWYVAGFYAYSFVAMVCLEPTWQRKIFNSLLGIGTINLCFLSDFPGSSKPMLILLFIILIVILPFTRLSVYRFKQGRQD